MRTLRKNARNNDQHAERKRVPYKLASYEQDHEGKKFKSSKVVFSFWSASKYVLILSLMLWWLPMFGQMIAGYVGGRRAGSPWKGVIASIIPVVALYGLMAGFSSGFFPSHISGVAIAPAAISAALTHNIPFLSPYLHFSSEYVGAFVKGLAGASPYGINTYVLTVAFAYIGGVLAEQNRREIEYNSGSVTSNTTVLVHDPRVFDQGAPQGQGWFANIGSHMHLPAILGGSSGSSGGFLHRSRGNGDWAEASDMHYDESVMDVDEDGTMVADDDQGYSQPHRSRHHHHHKHDGGFSHQHHKDPWQPKQKRRGAPNYSAKPRFRYQQYENEKFQNNSFRRSQSFPKFTVAPNPKSIRRAEKLINQDWGNRKYPNYRDVSSGADYEEEPEESAAVAIPKKEHHRLQNQWDQI